MEDAKLMEPMNQWGEMGDIIEIRIDNYKDNSLSTWKDLLYFDTWGIKLFSEGKPNHKFYLEIIHYLIDNYIKDNPFFQNGSDISSLENDIPKSAGKKSKWNRVETHSGFYFKYRDSNAPQVKQIFQYYAKFAPEIVGSTKLFVSKEWKNNRKSKENSESKEIIITGKQYWIFQWNPDKFPVIQYLKENSDIEWSVNQNQNQMRIGDMVYFWVSWTVAWIYAVWEITSEVMDSQDTKFGKNKVRIRICWFLWEDHIPKASIMNNEILKNMHVKKYPAATNYKLSESEQNEIQKLLPVYEEPIKNSKNLNTILYGPPGTGKTYNTVNHALSIIESKSLSEIQGEEKINGRKALKSRFDDYKEQWQIVFTTFHQSFWYEEFIEGLRASTDGSGNVVYSVESWIFKKISDTALENLEDSQKESSKLRSELGTKQKLESFLNDNAERETFFEKVKWKFQITGYSEWKIIIHSEDALAAQKRILIRFDELISVIESQENPKTGDDIQKFFKRKWRTQGDSYLLAIFKSFKKYSTGPQARESIEDLDEIDVELKQYVLIIDEINRGNISKIFGELITLIEDSKRIGEPEEIRVSLPYSKDDNGTAKPFGVPNNLHILWTMNTADRSIALMDLALRRRFVFREMLPDSGLLDGIFVGDIDIRKMFETINKRIEYLYDRDHAIGHSFFLLLKKTPTLEALNGIFLNGIIPLLQEYFYDDWEKIQIVLGDHPDQKGFKNPDDRIIRSEIMDKKSELGFDFDDGMTGKPSYAVHAPENSRSYVWIYQKPDSQRSEDA